MTADPQPVERPTGPPVDIARFPERLQAAWARRADFRNDPDTNAYRVFHGHGDGDRSIDVDRYGDCAIVSVKTGILEPDHSRALQQTIEQICGVSRTIVRLKRFRSGDPTPLRIDDSVADPGRGQRHEGHVVALENGLSYEIDPWRDDQPGLFLDARPLRDALRRNASDRRVLNLFAFTGSLGVAALAGNAHSVTHVDKRREPLDIARRNHELNGQSVDDRAFVVGDVFQHLPKVKRAGRQFGVVILDPPPEFRTTRKRRGTPARSEFKRCIRLATPLVEPNGLLVVLFHRFDRSRDEYESDCQSAFGDQSFEVLERGHAGDDFEENAPERAMRFAVFKREG